MAQSGIDTRKGQRTNQAGQRQYFTIEEANRALVLVKRIVADIVVRYAHLVDLQETIEAAQTGGAYDRCEAAQRELVAAAERVQACAEELDDVGVVLKDWSSGVVDFPCLIDGREAYLCWRHGEERVEYWHELDEGAAGRRHVREIMPQTLTV